jgi:hypothetical protein
MIEVDQKVAHLQMVQAVITRMAGNSFSLKTLSATLVAAVLAYLGAVAGASKLVAIAGALAVVLFWLLDATYLRLERLFRKLYDGIRDDRVSRFSMDVSGFVGETASVARIAFSWSVLWFYLALFIVVLLAGWLR